MLNQMLILSLFTITSKCTAQVYAFRPCDSGFLSLRTLTFGAGSFFLWGLPYALWGDQQYPVGASCAFSPAVTLKTVSRH